MPPARRVRRVRVRHPARPSTRGRLDDADVHGSSGGRWGDVCVPRGMDGGELRRVLPRRRAAGDARAAEFAPRENLRRSRDVPLGRDVRVRSRVRAHGTERNMRRHDVRVGNVSAHEGRVRVRRRLGRDEVRYGEIQGPGATVADASTAARATASPASASARPDSAASVARRPNRPIQRRTAGRTARGTPRSVDASATEGTSARRATRRATRVRIARGTARARPTERARASRDSRGRGARRARTDTPGTRSARRFPRLGRTSATTPPRSRRIAGTSP